MEVKKVEDSQLQTEEMLENLRKETNLTPEPNKNELWFDPFALLDGELLDIFFVDM